MDIFFISGTGTEVGKTYVTCSLIRVLRSQARRVGAYKPVASGCTLGQDRFRESEDANRLYRALVSEMSGSASARDYAASLESLGHRHVQELICPQRFLAPVAPDEAARREGRLVDHDAMRGGIERWRDHCDVLLVEGAGGLFSPLGESILNIDFFQELELARLILVAPNRLGVIHDVLATAQAASARGVYPESLFLCSVQDAGDQSSRSNAQQIADWCPELRIQTISFGNDAAADAIG